MPNIKITQPTKWNNVNLTDATIKYGLGREPKTVIIFCVKNVSHAEKKREDSRKQSFKPNVTKWQNEYQQ